MRKRLPWSYPSSACVYLELLQTEAVHAMPAKLLGASWGRTNVRINNIEEDTAAGNHSTLSHYRGVPPSSARLPCQPTLTTLHLAECSVYSELVTGHGRTSTAQEQAWCHVNLELISLFKTCSCW
jgi:hypothetical protein